MKESMKFSHRTTIISVSVIGLFFVSGLFTSVEASHDDVQCDSFTASDYRVDEGDRVTLKWRTTDADDVYINNGVGYVDDDGSERVRVYEDTTFKLTARNGSDRDTCTVRIRVDEDDDVQCDSFTSSDYRVDEGDRITLKWRTTDADDVYINNGVGYVDDDGSERVRVYEDTTFKLTARNGSDRDTCTLRIRVDEDGYGYTGYRIGDYDYTRGGYDYGYVDYRIGDYSYTRTGGEVAGASVTNNVTNNTSSQKGVVLGSTPYTGFEAGKVLTFIFYLAIGLWAAVIAYVLVLRRSNVAEVVPDTPHVLNTYNTVVPDTTVEDIPSQIDFETNSVPGNIPAADVFEHAGDSIQTLESHAHSNFTLISSDGLRYIESQGDSLEEQTKILDSIVEKAKAKYPKEGDWLVLNKDRILSLLG